MLKLIVLGCVVARLPRACAAEDAIEDAVARSSDGLAIAQGDISGALTAAVSAAESMASSANLWRAESVPTATVVLRLFGVIMPRNAIALVEYRRACFNAGCTVVVIYDKTTLNSKFPRKLKRTLALLDRMVAPRESQAPVWLDVMHSRDVEVLFPQLSRQQLMKEQGRDIFGGERELSLCHGFGIFCVLTVVHALRTGAATDSDRDSSHPLLTAAYVWNIEDDTRYSGDVSAFFRKYSAVDAHFITAAVATPPASWPSTEEHTWQVPSSAVLMKKEHVERFSRRFLDVMLDMGQVGVVGFGELYASTVCSLIDWCTTRDLENDGEVGAKFDWNTEVSTDEWRAIISEERTRNKWWHALKSEWLTKTKS